MDLDKAQQIVMPAIDMESNCTAPWYCKGKINFDNVTLFKLKSTDNKIMKKYNAFLVPDALLAESLRCVMSLSETIFPLLNTSSAQEDGKSPQHY